MSAKEKRNTRQCAIPGIDLSLFFLFILIWFSENETQEARKIEKDGEGLAEEYEDTIKKGKKKKNDS